MVGILSRPSPQFKKLKKMKLNKKSARSIAQLLVERRQYLSALQNIFDVLEAKKTMTNKFSIIETSIFEETKKALKK